MSDRSRACLDGDHAPVCTGYFDPIAGGYAGRETYRCLCDCHGGA